MSDYPDMLDLVRIAVRSIWECTIITTRGKVAVYFSHDEIGGASFRVED